MKPQYEELAQRVKKGMEWIDSPGRAQAEIDQWFPTFTVLFNQITLMEREIRREGNKR
jgi:hypothetical protein